MTPFEKFLDRVGAVLRTAVEVGAHVHRSYKRGFK